VRAIGFHWHAVQREILGLGRRAADMFTPRFTAAEIMSVVMAPNTDSALFYEMSRGYSLADHLLTVRRDRRPAEPPAMNDPDAPVQHIACDTMTIEQFEARMRAHTGG